MFSDDEDDTEVMIDCDNLSMKEEMPTNGNAILLVNSEYTCIICRFRDTNSPV